MAEDDHPLMLEKGFFSRMTGPSVPRNVRKFIRVQKSEPFPPGGRPPSLLYDNVYQSEIFDDIATLNPSLIAEITNPIEGDCKLRVNVYYSSSLTNSKEILFAGTSFNLRDVTRCTKPIYSSVMVSEHCVDSIALIRVVPTLEPVLNVDKISCKNDPMKPWNPMFQRYIFHPNISHSAPVVCEEYTWEPRLAFHVPLVFLQNFADVMNETIAAWKVRSELERIRQGRFKGREEAFLNGWFETSISISAARISSMSAERRVSDDRSSSADGSGISMDLLDGAGGRVMSTDSMSASPSVSRTASTAHKVGGVLPRMPSSFVQAVLENRAESFSTHVGRTNTEHNTLFPWYGCNQNTSRQQQKGPTGHNTTNFQLSPLADADNVRISRTPHDYRLDTLAMTSSEQGYTVVPDLSASDRPKAKRGTKNIFHVFTPVGGGESGGRLRLDLMFEDPGGKEVVVGVGYVNLHDLVPRDSPPATSIAETWVPVSIVNSLADPKWVVCSAEVLVGVSIQQQKVNGSEDLPPVSPNMPLVRCYNPAVDSITYNSVLRNLEVPVSAGTSDVQVGIVSEGTLPQKPMRRPTFTRFASDRLSDSDDESSESESGDDENGSAVPSQVRSSSQSGIAVKDDVRDEASVGSLSMAALSSSPSGAPPLDMRRAALCQDRILAECYEWMWHIGFTGLDPLSTVTFEGSEDSNGGMLKSRADVQYSSTWLAQHILTLEELLCHVKCLIAFYAEKITEMGNRFRPSKLKKEIEYQALPVNLHIQLMTLQKCDAVNGMVSNPGSTKQSSSSETQVRVIDSITCGAMSPHGLGFKNGGLSNIELHLQRSKSSLDSLKSQYQLNMGRLGARSDRLCFSSHGKTAALKDTLCRAALAYEGSTADVTIRRMYALSQALSISVNSFIYKLEMVVAGHIPTFFLDRWLTHGYLLLFECLLSVNGKERGMIEDSRTAVEMLNKYQIRILPAPKSQSQKNPATTNTWLADHVTKSADRRGYSSWWWDRVDTEKAAVHMIGREVLLFLPDEIIDSLAENIRSQIYSTGCEVALRPVMFSQGIDIMQSITNTWDSSDAGLSSRDLQLQINISGLRNLNAYCELVQPINNRSLSSVGGTSDYSMSTAEETTPSRHRSRGSSTGHAYGGLTEDAHPLTGVLEDLIKYGDPSEKNVEMLLEIERICRMLGGCRVTFCKSGKDRTGMAITQEQSRLLGENFDCGQSVERIIRDANTMRLYGTRLMVAEKNIGKPVFAINRLQIQFLPLLYRPPLQVTEELIKKTDNS